MHIIFSGMDGAGKSTQIHYLRRRLGVSKTKVLWARGGYTPAFKFFKRIFKSAIQAVRPSKHNSSLAPNEPLVNSELKKHLFSSSLFIRLWLMISIFDLALYLGVYPRYLRLRGFTVIQDRSYADTQIDFLLRFPSEFSEESLTWRVLLRIMPRPDFAFLMLVDPKVSMQRSEIKNDQYADSFNVLTDRYRLYKDVQHISGRRVVTLQCTAPIELIHNQILNALQACK